MSVLADALAARPEPIPGCPATVTATRRFAQVRWGVDLYADGSTTALTRRERVMIERRAAGDARGADVFGWLSLAAVIIGATAAQITRLGRLDDMEAALAAVAAAGGIAGEVATPDAPVVDVEVGPLNVPDVGSRAGWALAQLAARAASAPSVTMHGQLRGAAPVIADLKRRLNAASRRRP